MDMRELFGWRVRVARKELAWSQEQLGLRVGMHQASISYIENATVCPGLDSIIGIAEALGRPVKWFFTAPAPASKETVSIPAVDIVRLMARLNEAMLDLEEVRSELGESLPDGVVTTEDTGRRLTPDGGINFGEPGYAAALDWDDPPEDPAGPEARRHRQLHMA